ncbi:hypothetical protein [Vibrio phage vB_VhaP_PG11]|nr:hypothetical protein [Vibrio phage vB_VhaP_PG11]
MDNPVIFTYDEICILGAFPKCTVGYISLNHPDLDFPIMETFRWNEDKEIHQYWASEEECWSDWDTDIYLNQNMTGNPKFSSFNYIHIPKEYLL